MLKETQILLALAANADGEAPPEFRILSKGENKTKKGTVHFDAESEKHVLTAYSDHGADLMIDYEHKSILTAGAPVDGGKAAGWFKPAVRNGELWATEVQWTDAAKAALKSREYRYFSPALMHDEKGRVHRLVNVALTNLPATQGLRALVASDTVPSKDDQNMDKDTEVALFAALSADSLSAALGTITALQEEAGKVKTLSAELATLKLDVATRDVDKLLSEAKDAGKVSEAELPALREQGIKDVKWLSGYLAIKTPAPAATKEVKAPKTPIAGEVTDVDKAVCRLFAVKPADFAKTRALLASGEDINTIDEEEVA
jgi:phage I-like protein